MDLEDRLRQTAASFPEVKLVALFGSTARGQAQPTDFKVRAMVDWWDWAPTHRMIAAGVARRLREQVNRGQT